jgi:thioredoxin reductase (NADPH)
MKSLDKQYDVLVIGGGPAGIWAGYLAHVKGLKPLLIEQNSILGGQPLYLYGHKKIYDYPGFVGITAYELINKFVDQFAHAKIPTLLKTSIKSIQLLNNVYEMEIDNNKIIRSKYIIIATGAGLFAPNKLEIPGVNKNNTSYTVGPQQEYKNKNVVILGGGDSSVD